MSWLDTLISSRLGAATRARTGAERPKAWELRLSPTFELLILRELRAIRHALEIRRPIRLVVPRAHHEQHDMAQMRRAAARRQRIRTMRARTANALSARADKNANPLPEVLAEIRDLIRRLAENTAATSAPHSKGRHPSPTRAAGASELAGDLQSLGRVLAFAPRDPRCKPGHALPNESTDGDPPPSA
jgi:hypothetical protein